MTNQSKNLNSLGTKAKDLNGEINSRREMLLEFGLPKVSGIDTEVVGLDPEDIEAILLLSIKYSDSEVFALCLAALFEKKYSAKDLIKAVNLPQGKYDVVIAKYLQNYIDACKTFSPHQVLSGMRSVININYEP